MSFDRPDLRWPLHDVTDNNSALLPTVAQTNGFQPDDVADEKVVNALFRSAGGYIGYLDCGGVRNIDWLSTPSSSTPATRVTLDQWAYPTLLGLGPFDPSTRPSYIFEGTRTEVDLSVIAPDPQIRPGSAGGTFLFAQSKVTWIYMTEGGITTIDVLPVATPAAPPAGSFACVGVTTDAFNIVSLDYTGTPAHELIVGATPLRFAVPAVFDATVDFNGVVGFETLNVKELTAGSGTGVPITVVGTPASVVGLNVTGAGDTTAVQVAGVGHTAITATSSGTETVAVVVATGSGRALFALNDDAANCTAKVENLGDACAMQIDSNGSTPTIEVKNAGTGSGATIDNDDIAAPTLIATNSVPAGVAVQAVGVIEASAGYRGPAATPADFPVGASVANAQTIALGAGAAVTGPATTSVTVGTVDTIDPDGVVLAGQYKFYSTATPSGITGEMMFKGRFITIGVGGDIKKVAVYFEDDVLGPVSTGLAITDTGASVTIPMLLNEEVMVEVSMESKQSDITNDVNVNILTDTVGIIGSSEPYRGVVNDVYFAVRRVVKYTALADGLVTFTARHGASATTTTSQNIHIGVRYAGIFA